MLSVPLPAHAALAALALSLVGPANAQSCPHIGTSAVPPQAYPIGELPCVSAVLAIRELTVTPPDARCPTHVEVVPLHWAQVPRQGYRISSYEAFPKLLYAYECRQHSFLFFTTGVSCALRSGPTPSGTVRSYHAEACPGATPIPSSGPTPLGTR